MERHSKSNKNGCETQLPRAVALGMRMAVGHKGHHYHQTKCGLCEAQTEKPQTEYTARVFRNLTNGTGQEEHGTSTLGDVTTTSAKARTRAESDQTGNEPRSPYQQKDARPINTRSQGPIRNGRRTDGKCVLLSPPWTKRPEDAQRITLLHNINDTRNMPRIDHRTYHDAKSTSNCNIISI